MAWATCQRANIRERSEKAIFQEILGRNLRSHDRDAPFGGKCLPFPRPHPHLHSRRYANPCPSSHSSRIPCQKIVGVSDSPQRGIHHSLLKGGPWVWILPCRCRRGQRRPLSGEGWTRILLSHVRPQSPRTHDEFCPIKATGRVCDGGGDKSQNNQVWRNIPPLLSTHLLGLFHLRRLLRRFPRPSEGLGESQDGDEREFSGVRQGGGTSHPGQRDRATAATSFVYRIKSACIPHRPLYTVGRQQHIREIWKAAEAEGRTLPTARLPSPSATRARRHSWHGPLTASRRTRIVAVLSDHVDRR